VSDFTLRWLSKKCNVAKEPHGTGDYLGRAMLGTKRPQSLKAGASWQSGSK